MTLGVHAATLVVRTNDPRMRSFSVPVTMTIVPEYTLTMAVTGNGTVEPAIGNHVYRDGTVVPITATADSGWAFAGWQGAAADSNAASTTVTMDADKVVTATFVALYTLDVTIVGEGHVTVDPAQATYVYGDVVTVTAEADAGWTFAGWSGDASGADGVTTVTIMGDTVVTATFVPLPDLYVVKTVTPTTDVDLGDVVTFTIELVNSGAGAATGIVLTDTLPAGVVFDAFVTNDGAAEEDAGVISWTGVLAQGETLTITFTATVEEDEALYNTTITNTVEFTSANGGGGSDAASFTVKRLYRVLLLMVMKNYTP